MLALAYTFCCCWVLVYLAGYPCAGGEVMTVLMGCIIGMMSLGRGATPCAHMPHKWTATSDDFRRAACPAASFAACHESVSTLVHTVYCKPHIIWREAC